MPSTHSGVGSEEEEEEEMGICVGIRENPRECSSGTFAFETGSLIP